VLVEDNEEGGKSKGKKKKMALGPKEHLKMVAKTERQPHQPRHTASNRPFTAKDRQEQMDRFPIQPHKYNKSTDNFPIKTPVARPNQSKVLQDQADLEFKEQKKHSTKRPAAERAQESRESSPNANKESVKTRSVAPSTQDPRQQTPDANTSMQQDPANGKMMDKEFERETPDIQFMSSQMNTTQPNHAVMQLIPEVIRQVYRQDQDTQAMNLGIQTTEFLHLHNPRNYKFLPASFTDRIRESGKLASHHQTRNIVTNEFINGYNEKTEKLEERRQSPDQKANFGRKKLISKF